jgi:hypothetical protein
MTKPDDLTSEERNAIAALERLAKRWPPSLKLFSWSGLLCVVPNGVSLSDSDDPDGLVITTIAGIPNDGGDP